MTTPKIFPLPDSLSQNKLKVLRERILKQKQKEAGLNDSQALNQSVDKLDESANVELDAEQQVEVLEKRIEELQKTKHELFLLLKKSLRRDDPENQPTTTTAATTTTTTNSTTPIAQQQQQQQQQQQVYQIQQHQHQHQQSNSMTGYTSTTPQPTSLNQAGRFQSQQANTGRALDFKSQMAHIHRSAATQPAQSSQQTSQQQQQQQQALSHSGGAPQQTFLQHVQHQPQHTQSPHQSAPTSRTQPHSQHQHHHQRRGPSLFSQVRAHPYH